MGILASLLCATCDYPTDSDNRFGSSYFYLGSCFLLDVFYYQPSGPLSYDCFQPNTANPDHVPSAPVSVWRMGGWDWTFGSWLPVTIETLRKLKRLSSWQLGPITVVRIRQNQSHFPYWLAVTCSTKNLAFASGSPFAVSRKPVLGSFRGNFRGNFRWPFKPSQDSERNVS